MKIIKEVSKGEIFKIKHGVLWKDFQFLIAIMEIETKKIINSVKINLETDLSETEVKVLVPQLFPTLCDPMDCSLPGSSVHGFFRQEYWSGLPLNYSNSTQNSIASKKNNFWEQGPSKDMLREIWKFTSRPLFFFRLKYDWFSVNFCFLAKGFRCTYMYILFHILFHYGLWQDIEYSCLCDSIGPCLSILYIIICVC